MKEILSIRQVATLCAVAPSTVQFWERKGYLKSFKTLGGHRRFEKGHVLEFLEKRGRRLSREAVSSIIEGRNRNDRRCEERLPVKYLIQAQMNNGIPDLSIFQGQIIDISSKGFGIQLTIKGFEKSAFETLMERYRCIKTWLKDQVGYLKNPLEGTIRNIFYGQDTVRIGLSFSR